MGGGETTCAIDSCCQSARWAERKEATLLPLEKPWSTMCCEGEGGEAREEG